MDGPCCELIFTFLNVWEQGKLKSVCRKWREELLTPGAVYLHMDPGEIRRTYMPHLCHLPWITVLASIMEFRQLHYPDKVIHLQLTSLYDIRGDDLTRATNLRILSTRFGSIELDDLRSLQLPPTVECIRGLLIHGDRDDVSILSRLPCQLVELGVNIDRFYLPALMSALTSQHSLRRLHLDLGETGWTFSRCHCGCEGISDSEGDDLFIKDDGNNRYEKYNEWSRKRIMEQVRAGLPWVSTLTLRLNHE